MLRYFIEISYDGSDYNGWQIQDNSPNTIQQVIQDKFELLIREKIELIGCGRTDSGVHAKKFYAHFDSENLSRTESLHHWCYKLNMVLPKSIAVHSIIQVPDQSHARFDALERTYHYFLHQNKDPFKLFSWYQFGELDFNLMNKAAILLLKHIDFTSFSKLNTQTKTNNCKVKVARWEQLDDNSWCFVIISDRFLRNMVRAIVGTLLEVGKKKITVDEFETIVTSKNRSNAGMSAPAHGLFLVDVKYPETIQLD